MGHVTAERLKGEKRGRFGYMMVGNHKARCEGRWLLQAFTTAIMTQ